MDRRAGCGSGSRRAARASGLVVTMRICRFHRRISFDDHHPRALIVTSAAGTRDSPTGDSRDRQFFLDLGCPCRSSALSRRNPESSPAAVRRDAHPPRLVCTSRPAGRSGPRLLALGVPACDLRDVSGLPTTAASPCIKLSFQAPAVLLKPFDRPLQPFTRARALFQPALHAGVPFSRRSGRVLLAARRAHTPLIGTCAILCTLDVGHRHPPRLARRLDPCRSSRPGNQLPRREQLPDTRRPSQHRTPVPTKCSRSGAIAPCAAASFCTPTFPLALDPHIRLRSPLALHPGRRVFRPYGVYRHLCTFVQPVRQPPPLSASRLPLRRLGPRRSGTQWPAAPQASACVPPSQPPRRIPVPLTEFVRDLTHPELTASVGGDRKVTSVSRPLRNQPRVRQDHHAVPHVHLVRDPRVPTNASRGALITARPCWVTSSVTFRLPYRTALS